MPEPAAPALGPAAFLGLAAGLAGVDAAPVRAVAGTGAAALGLEGLAAGLAEPSVKRLLLGLRPVAEAGGAAACAAACDASPAGGLGGLGLAALPAALLIPAVLGTPPASLGLAEGLMGLPGPFDSTGWPCCCAVAAPACCCCCASGLSAATELPASAPAAASLLAASSAPASASRLDTFLGLLLPLSLPL